MNKYLLYTLYLLITVFSGIVAAKTEIVTINDQSQERDFKLLNIGDTVRFLNAKNQPVRVKFRNSTSRGFEYDFVSDIINPGAYFEHKFSTAALVYFMVYSLDDSSVEIFNGDIEIHNQTVYISPSNTLVNGNKDLLVTVFYHLQTTSLPCDCESQYSTFEIHNNIALTVDQKTLFDGRIYDLLDSPLVTEHGDIQYWHYFIIKVPANTLAEGRHIFQVKSKDSPIIFEETYYNVIK